MPPLWCHGALRSDNSNYEFNSTKNETVKINDNENNISTVIPCCAFVFKCIQ